MNKKTINKAKSQKAMGRKILITIVIVALLFGVVVAYPNLVFNITNESSLSFDRVLTFIVGVFIGWQCAAEMVSKALEKKYISIKKAFMYGAICGAIAQIPIWATSGLSGVLIIAMPIGALIGMVVGAVSALFIGAILISIFNKK